MSHCVGSISVAMRRTRTHLRHPAVSFPAAALCDVTEGGPLFWLAVVVVTLAKEGTTTRKR